MPPVTEETTRIAPAAFPKCNVYRHIRDELGTIYTDDLFAETLSAVLMPTSNISKSR